MMVWRTLGELRAELERARAQFARFNIGLSEQAENDRQLIVAAKRRCTELTAELEKERKRAEESSRVWRRPAEEMSAEELRTAFDVGEDNDLWLAVLQVIDDRVLSKVEDVAQAPAQDYGAEARAHDAGGLDELRELTRQLLELRGRARGSNTEVSERGAQPRRSLE
jgi:hypothetical protein